MYLKNIRNDIIGIIDFNGNLVVEYIYNAYGIGISSSKFGFAPISGSLYIMVPPIFVKCFIDGFSTLFSTVKTISALA